MNNERGGILSKLFVITASVVFAAGFFLLGYYVGRYQGKSDVPNAGLSPLPEFASKNLPKQEEFTFYKTLAAREDKTVSIELRPKSASEEGTAGRKQADDSPKEKGTATRNVKKNAVPDPAGMNAVRKTPVPQKKEVQVKQTASSKPRYAVQISSHQEKQTADLEVKKMKHQGFAAFIVSSELPGKGTWYRVRVGSFTNKEAADKLQKEVRAKAGVSSIVVTE